MLHVFKDLSFTFKIASGLLVINKVGGITLGVPTGTSASSAPQYSLALQAITVSPALWADGGSPAGKLGTLGRWWQSGWYDLCHTPFTWYQSKWYSTTSAQDGVYVLDSCAGQSAYWTPSAIPPMLTQPIILQHCLTCFNTCARSVNYSKSSPERWGK